MLQKLHKNPQLGSLSFRSVAMKKGKEFEIIDASDTSGKSNYFSGCFTKHCFKENNNPLFPLSHVFRKCTLNSWPIRVDRHSNKMSIQLKLSIKSLIITFKMRKQQLCCSADKTFQISSHSWIFGNITCNT